MSDTRVLYFDDEAGAACRFAETAGFSSAVVDRHRFPDGELKLRLPASLPAKVIVYRSLVNPNEKLIELLFVAQTARQLGANVLFNLRLHLVEFRRLALALVLDLDDVPAELALHRIGNLARLDLERDLREFRHHLFLGEVAKVAAVRSARILRLLLR